MRAKASFLGLTAGVRCGSTPQDLQKSETDSIPVYQRVAQQVAEWNEAEQFILVTGATYPEELGRVRQIVGDMPLLVPSYSVRILCSNQSLQTLF